MRRNPIAIARRRRRFGLERLHIGTKCSGVGSGVNRDVDQPPALHVSFTLLDIFFFLTTLPRLRKKIAILPHSPREFVAMSISSISSSPAHAAQAASVTPPSAPPQAPAKVDSDGGREGGGSSARPGRLNI